MRRVLALALLLSALVAPAAAAQDPTAAPPQFLAARPSAPSPECSLPAGLWQRRQALKQQFDSSGGHSEAALQGIQSIDARYRRFLVAVSNAYNANQPAALQACCPGGSRDPEAAIFCALTRYLQDGRKEPDRFLAALPQTPETAAALDNLEQAASPNQPASALAALPVYNVTEELYRLIIAANSRATATYFWLLHHSSGAWADDAADQLERLLRNHPDAVIRDWPFLKNDWNLSEGITWDVDGNWWQDTIKGFQSVCKTPDPRCREVLALLEAAARAAGLN